jgi:hypothetical protein
MNTMKYIMKYITPKIAVTILVLIAGCSATGLPPGARVVGGGLQIEWAPPEDGGTAILFEQTTRKTVATATVSKRSPFMFNAATERGAAVIRSVFITDWSTNWHFVLYYVPPRKR